MFDRRNSRPIINDGDVVRLVGKEQLGRVDGIIPSHPVDRIVVRWPHNQLHIYWPEELEVIRTK